MKLVENTTRMLNKAGFVVKKHSPEICMVLGVGGMITAAVMACKATTKLNDVLEDNEDTINTIKKQAEKKSEAYTEKDAKKDLTKAYLKTGLDLAKLYGPSVIVGTLSVTSIVASNVILKKRNIALAAAYTAVDKGFKEYRGRVVERFGTELDKELRYNIKAKEFEEPVVDEKGKEKIKKETVSVADPNLYSDYARFFDDGCLGWSKDAEYNLTFLKQQQNYANDLLKKKGHLFLNEVYDMLGIPRTRAGQVVGWIYDEKHPIGDNFVDFGIYDMNREKVRDFVNGYERVILLDFNVDGNILDLI